MAKAISKSKAGGKPAAKSAPKKSAPRKATKKDSPHALIEKTCVASLKKLQALNLDTQLQAEIEWCLGSYRHDGNAVGLYQMAERARNVFQAEAARGAKGVTPKLIKDIDKALKAG